MPVPKEAKSRDNDQRNGSANEYTRESCESFWVEGVHAPIAGPRYCDKHSTAEGLARLSTTPWSKEPYLYE